MGPMSLVIFDCDGVLVDSERLMIGLYKSITAAVGWDLDQNEIVERFVGRSHGHVVNEVEAATGIHLDDAWEAEYLRQEHQLFVKALRPVEGVLAAMDAITTQTCVASSGSHDKMRFTLGLTGIYGRFAGRIFSGDDVVRGKPEPDLFLYAAESMGVSPTDCAVVEDSVPGIRAARAAEMTALGYAGGVTPAESLRQAGAIVFDRMAELPSLLESVRTVEE
jgi:HAD superfamily hydrolase (TIGR01509 family)